MARGGSFTEEQTALIVSVLESRTIPRPKPHPEGAKRWSMSWWQCPSWKKRESYWRDGTWANKDSWRPRSPRLLCWCASASQGRERRGWWVALRGSSP